MNWKNNCKCFHHWVPKVLQALAWAAAALFFWSSLRQELVLGYDASYYAFVVILLMLISFSSGGGCKCCGKAKGGSEGSNMCSHEGGCGCGDCGKCKVM